MSFSGTAVQQREQELKTIKTFLIYSLLGSLALHISLLLSGLGNLLLQVPEIAEEPLEVTVVETPPEPEPLQPAEQPQPDVVEKTQILTSSNSQPGGGGDRLSINTSASTSELKPQPQQNKVVANTASPVIPFPKIEPLKPLPSIPKETVSKKASEPQEPQSQVTAPDSQNILTQSSSPDGTTVQASSQTNTNLSRLLAGIRDNRATSQLSQGTESGNGAVTSNSSGIPGSGSGTGSGNGSGTGSGNGSGSGSGSGSGNGNGNGSGSGNGNGNGSGSGSKVATAPTTPKIRTNSGDGRAACRECNTSYPEWARKRGLEGRVEVAVDTDTQGNVTNVRLLRSSGNDRLDAEHLDRARKWKLKGSSGGRQGVTIGTEYAIAGSQRYRQLQERKKQRETEQRNSESTNSASNSATETPRRRRRLVTSVSDNIPQQSNTETRRIRRRRNVAASKESTSTLSTSSGQRLGETIRRRRRIEQTATNNSSGETRKRRRRRDITPASSVNSNSASTPKTTRRRRRLEQPVLSESSTN